MSEPPDGVIVREIFPEWGMRVFHGGVLRSENPQQTVEEFMLLGHTPKVKEFDGLGGLQTVCTLCSCWIGSQQAANPCGDPLGHTIKFVPGHYTYKGKIL